MTTGGPMTTGVRRHGRVGMPAGRATILAALIAALVPAIAVMAAPAPPPVPATPIAPAMLLAPGVPDAGPVAPAITLPPPPGTTSRVSVPASGVQANNLSSTPGISGDGRWVAFSSAATNLVANDTNNSIDLFVKDLETGALVRVPYPANFSPITGSTAAYPSLSADGEWLVFEYLPPGAVIVDVPLATRIFLWQRSRNVTVEISPQQLPATGRLNPSISPDGLFVAYDALPTSTTTQAFRQVHLWNRITGGVTLVSVNSQGVAGVGSSYGPSVSNGGAVVAFLSNAASMAGVADNNPAADVYVRDMAAAQTKLVTPVPQPPSPTGAPEYQNEGARVSADGRFVAFGSQASYVALDTNKVGDVYRFERQTGAYDLVSVDATGKAAAGYSGQPAITPTGRYVAFTSQATDVIDTPIRGATGPITGTFAGPTPVATSEIYIREMVTPETIRASVSTNAAASGQSLRPVVSDDGGHIAWDSTGTNLVANDTNQQLDVFLRDIPGLLVALPNPLDFGVRAVGTTSLPAAVTLGNDGWADVRVAGLSLAGANPGDFTVLADPCSGSPLSRGAKCSAALVFSPKAAGTRSGVLNIVGAASRTPTAIRLAGRASDAKLDLSEDIGARGRVVTATGTGFPAGAVVRLRWSVGITPTLPKIVADAKGGFKIQVLVFHHDPLGPRKLIAEPPAGSTQFVAAEADYLVIESPAVPPGFNLPGPLSDAIITRR